MKTLILSATTYREKDESDSESSSDTSSENEENDVESDCYYDMKSIESDQEPAAFGSPTTNQQQEGTAAMMNRLPGSIRRQNSVLSRN